MGMINMLQKFKYCLVCSICCYHVINKIKYISIRWLINSRSLYDCSTFTIIVY